jgi:hypothetical protein
MAVTPINFASNKLVFTHIAMPLFSKLIYYCQTRAYSSQPAAIAIESLTSHWQLVSGRAVDCHAHFDDVTMVYMRRFTVGSCIDYVK